jgi:hypothetical protein
MISKRVFDRKYRKRQILVHCRKQSTWKHDWKPVGKLLALDFIWRESFILAEWFDSKFHPRDERYASDFSWSFEDPFKQLWLFWDLFRSLLWDYLASERQPMEFMDPIAKCDILARSVHGLENDGWGMLGLELAVFVPVNPQCWAFPRIRKYHTTAAITNIFPESLLE